MRLPDIVAALFLQLEKDLPVAHSFGHLFLQNFAHVFGNSAGVRVAARDNVVNSGASIAGDSAGAVGSGKKSFDAFVRRAVSIEIGRFFES